MAEVLVELLTKAHDRKSFDSGAANQNEFLRLRARKHAELGYSQTYVAVEQGETRILGFVTLSLGSIEFDEINEQIRARLPRYPMPVVRLGQLATDIEFQGRGIGRLLLKFAIEKTVEVSLQLGCYALVIEADNQKAYDWYLSKGFLPLRACRVANLLSRSARVSERFRTPPSRFAGSPTSLAEEGGVGFLGPQDAVKLPCDRLLSERAMRVHLPVESLKAAVDLAEQA